MQIVRKDSTTNQNYFTANFNLNYTDYRELTPKLDYSIGQTWNNNYNFVLKL